ncbi:Delta(7)-sterol 5(6)-desaturase like protein [Verticillium longisporum]|nr:Delta(7)-sterol 5(6)-desaturase like protein [Verticillium longisporum]
MYIPCSLITSHFHNVLYAARSEQTLSDRVDSSDEHSHHYATRRSDSIQPSAGNIQTVANIAYSYNYGQFTTLWDRWGGSYRKPDGAWFDRNTKMSETTWKSGIEEMEAIQKQVEGEDDRTYSTGDAKKTN